MFLVYLIVILIAFSFAYLSTSLITMPTSMDEQLAHWVSFFIFDRVNIALTFLILLLIFILLNKPSKYILKIMLTKSNSFFSWEKIKGVILLLLLINLFFYLFIIYGWYLIIPFLSFLIIKVTMLN